ncbi:hypothetical protein P3342_005863 [Pyrenophora teres f. teres]|uniref:Uncharacterized protein n=1 Tax=Pyrenophora teres f. teres TaxID=97479 RepID=A0A6S6VYB4_9PLEO|nr:hypothetical protein HRS9139_00274 [Pyrenophora teres f. teres]KAE8872536.1 hypothetical protein PTNB73_01687 [Pyrenophora teres f. teres]KAK1907536.1 hypothetical protein P3342_005863 [Pyrenophora teres f. teres]CAE7026840.1 hypothetical protein PTTW11_04144 [Pyrenophora teres f. teres]
MSITLTQPTDYPAALLKYRVDPPKHLYIAAPEADKVATSLGIPQYGRFSEYTKSNIEVHLAKKRKGEDNTSGLVSTYGSEDAALNSKGRMGSEKRGVLALRMKDMAPVWLVLGKGVYVPAWVEQKTDNHETIKGDRVWICLLEARIVLGIDEKLGEEEEWLACQPVILQKISKRTKVPDSNSREIVEKAFDEQEKEEEDKQARRQAGKASHAKLRRTPSTSSLHPPHIPARRSSLNSLSLKVAGSTESSADSSSKLKVTTRDATISLTNADQHRATSLMKYALLVAHGKRIEAEETWLLDTMPLNENLSRAGSLHTIGEGDTEGEDGEIRHDPAPEADTRSHTKPVESSRTSSRWNSESDLDDDESSRRHVYPGEETDSVQENRARTKRSLAPSPSQSMLGHNVQENREPSFHSRRSRRELLLELQCDEDSLLREYARVSLQASGVFDEQRDVSQDNYAASHAESQVPQHDDPAEEDMPPARKHTRLAASAYLTPSPPRPPLQPTPSSPYTRLHQSPFSSQPTTPQTAQSSSTLVNTPPSLYVTPPSSLQTPSSLRQSDTPSKSEALMARGKGLREKGKEIQSRLAEIRERQKAGDKKKKGGKGDAGGDIWGSIAEKEE